MRRQPVNGALVGGLMTAPLMALLYLGEQWWGLPFVPFDLFDWLARVLPGDVIRATIKTMVNLITELDLGETSSTAKRLETLAALLQFLGGGVILGAFYFALRERLSLPAGETSRRIAALALGLAFGLPLILISADINITTEISGLARDVALLVLFVGWGFAVEWAYNSLRTQTATAISEAEAVRSPDAMPPATAERLSRRAFLVRVGTTTATLTIAGAGIARYLEVRDEREYRRRIERYREVAVPAGLPNEDDPVTPAPGTRPEYTPLDDHYRIDINIRPLELDGETWRLDVHGLVDAPQEFTLEQLRSEFEPLSQYVTLACISNSVGGDLTSTTRWTGFRVADLLDAVGVQDEAGFLKITSADGFYETVSIELARSDPRMMLAYEWDGIPLLHKHGFPLRIYVPDLYGMKQPKWITEIEVMAKDQDGYWVERSWDKVAQMRATSVIDVVAADSLVERDGQTFVPIGGIAHAGARGISAVEVRVDEGEWMPAQLRAPLSETTWAVWRYEWPFEAGKHRFEVRCYEGDGTLQSAERRPTFPSGATGIHRQSRDV